MNPTITVFEASPDRGQGLARDMPVRWALEEVGQAYEVRLVSFSEMKEAAHLALQPFGQIPIYQEGELVLFESGAIVLHIAERHAGLLPDDANARARAITWMFAALSTMEPPIIELQIAKLLEGDKPWSEPRLPLVRDRLRVRLGDFGDYRVIHLARQLIGEELDRPGEIASVSHNRSGHADLGGQFRIEHLQNCRLHDQRIEIPRIERLNKGVDQAVFQA